MIKTIFIVLFITVQAGFSQSKPNVVVADKTGAIVLTADVFVGADNSGFYYYIKNNVLFKQKEAQIWQYQNVSLGTISKVDLINSLKIVVFYESFNSVVMLDNQLNEISVIDFSNLPDLIAVRNTGMSGQNSLWIFNTINQQLGLFNYETRLYKNLNQPLQAAIKWYQTDFNNFRWIDDQLNVKQMDVFGKLDNLGTVTDFDYFQFIQESKDIVWCFNNKLYFKKNNTNQTIEIDSGEKRIINFYYHDKILLIFTGAELVSFNLILP